MRRSSHQSGRRCSPHSSPLLTAPSTSARWWRFSPSSAPASLCCSPHMVRPQPEHRQSLSIVSNRITSRPTSHSSHSWPPPTPSPAIQVGENRLGVECTRTFLGHLLHSYFVLSSHSSRHCWNNEYVCSTQSESRFRLVHLGVYVSLTTTQTISPSLWLDAGS